MKRKWIKTGVQYLGAIVVAILLALTVRIFVLDFYAIPSDSMRPALEAGDFIVVNKLCYGARLYRNFDFLETGEEPETWRTKGWGEVKRNDVVVFNYPQKGKKRAVAMDISCFYVKRCIGLPGDTLSIRNGYYIVNGRTGYGNMVEQRQLAQETQPRPGCEYRTRGVAPGHNWNIRNFGPLYIPVKGATITIDSSNLRIYDRLIAYENRGKKLRIKANKAWLDNQPLNQYTFRQNWYFMAGDHLYNSRDSRYIGVVPEKFIIGKVVLVLTSRDRDTGAFRWERLLKRVKGGADRK